MPYFRSLYFRVRRRGARRLARLPVAIAAVLLAVLAAGPAQAQPSGLPPSVRWSGYVLTSGGYTSVSATWTVPGVTSPGPAQSLASTWVGLDGYLPGSNIPGTDLIQAGTMEGWQPGYGYAYYAFWQIGGSATKPEVVLSVSPGDSIYTSIRELSANKWSISIIDSNTGNSIAITEPYRGPGASAEFIQEDPGWPSQLQFAHSTGVTFRNARVNNADPDFNDSQYVVMNQDGAQLSTPSRPNEAANGFTVEDGPVVPAPPDTQVFQRRSDGSVWAATGAACNGSYCPGWQEIDDNPGVTAISAGAGTLYELRKDGSVWEWTGGGCARGSCWGWVELDDNPGTTAISAGAGTVFEIRNHDSVWRSTGQACSPRSCPGWAEIGGSREIATISAGAGTVFALEKNGSIWRWTGQGWTLLDVSPATVAISAGAFTVFQLHEDGSVWRWTGQGQQWTELGDNSATVQIAASDNS